MIDSRICVLDKHPFDLPLTSLELEEKYPVFKSTHIYPDDCPNCKEVGRKSVFAVYVSGCYHQGLAWCVKCGYTIEP